MPLWYEQINHEFKIYNKKSVHVPPHLHKLIEMIYVTRGTLELGIGTELYHMDCNDFAIVFPDVIHHYQVFSEKPSHAIYLQVSPDFAPMYTSVLQNSCPADPVIHAASVHPDITYAMKTLLRAEDSDKEYIIPGAFTQIILTHAFPHYNFVEKSSVGSNDIIYQTVAYAAEHFMENITLPKMAHDLGYSPYAISRVFSGTFHTNFNQYINSLRLEYARQQILYTDQSITDICFLVGFNSQRTFNRTFQEQYGMTPREYRKEGRLTIT